jgi:hypothetical protein
MKVISEDAEQVTIQLNPSELVGTSNSVLTALAFHRHELHALTALHPEEAHRLLDELLPVIDRLKERRIKGGLPW